MEEKILKIIQKIDNIGKYHPDIKRLKSGNPDIKMTINAKNKLVLTSITYDWYDTLLVCETGIILIPEHGQRKTIFSYNGWDELLNL
jgi:hypothetical protein